MCSKSSKGIVAHQSHHCFHTWMHAMPKDGVLHVVLDNECTVLAEVTPS